ncbi:MAG: bifunctional oligoribonuclease/PAP phosphatase NrnA [Muribaculaceae bacterium]|nr:bifunctional oligoribonuclease/PAP phosphatase NrnA [Muribaculaceae bacterium]
MISRQINEEAIAKAKSLIDGAERIVAVCHTGPDGDAIGSCLAATHVFSAIGKDIRTVIPDQCLFNLRTLPGAKEMVDAAKYPDFARQLIDEADLLLCLDFNEPRRTGRLEEAIRGAKAAKILIDHHLNPDIEADVVISHPEMPATAYLLFRFFCRLELFNFIDRKAAECLLAGMMTDTGNFSYNCSDPELFIVTAELIRKGADKEKLYRQLFATFSENCMRLNSYAILKKMEVFADSSAALITLSRDELNRFHYTKGDTEGLVNRPLAIPGVQYSCFMRQEADCIRVSMRSLGDFPVNKVCADHFGGGGHLNAAGGEFAGTLEEAAELFRSILKDNKKKYIDKK